MSAEVDALRQMAGISASRPLEAQAQEAQLKHVFFDFDQTLSRIHVFHALNRVANTERGQIQHLIELDAAGPWRYAAESGGIEQDPQGCSWSCAVLGGPSRVEMLRTLLSELQSAGTRRTVITKGYVGVIKYILAAQKLDLFFEMVYGFIGHFYARNGMTQYDSMHQTHRSTRVQRQ